MIRVGLLHTAASNVKTMEAAAARLAADDLALDHMVRADLIEAAERAGGLTDAVRADTMAAIDLLLQRNEMVLMTCSTLGPLADGDRVRRIDAALADAAIAAGGKVVVLCTSPTTMDATRELFEARAAHSGTSVVVKRIENAWDLFRAGHIAAYDQAIAAAAESELAQGADVVALAQLSMSGATSFFPNDGRVLACAEIGLRSVRSAMSRAKS